MHSRDDLFMRSLKCHFGVYFPRCFATQEINTKITLSWAHNSPHEYIHYAIYVLCEISKWLGNWQTSRGVTIRLATIRYISRYTTHDMVHDTIQNQLIYYQWKILKHCGMCHQYCYIKTVILARNSEFKINKDVHNHPCPKYLVLTNCVCKQNNKIS